MVELELLSKLVVVFAKGGAVEDDMLDEMVPVPVPEVDVKVMIVVVVDELNDNVMLNVLAVVGIDVVEFDKVVGVVVVVVFWGTPDTQDPTVVSIIVVVKVLVTVWDSFSMQLSNGSLAHLPN